MRKWAVSKALELKDLKRLAKSEVPRMFFEYSESGSWSGSTFRANEEDFKHILFKQRVAVDMTNRTLASSMAGIPVSMPIALAPTGMCGMQDANGEIKAARAAARAGVPFTLSTMSICSIEDVAAAVPEAPFWFQVYMLKDRAFMRNLIERARLANCSALVLTLDLQILGQRHNDKRNHLSAPPAINLDTAGQFLTRPSWCLRMLTTAKRFDMGNIVGHATGVSNLASLSSWAAEQFDPALDWGDVAWVRELWPAERPLILKGIMCTEDALKAAEVGAAAVVVSNHGGRQLDGAPSSISQLPDIVEALRGTGVEVHMDGGVRSGQDVLKALCLGAQGTYIGRPYLYGLGAGGEAGVTRCLEIMANELDITMALCGERSVRTVGRHNLSRLPREWDGPN